MTVIKIVLGALWTFLKGLEKGLEQLEIRDRIKIIQNTEKSPGDLERPERSLDNNAGKKNTQGV